MKKLRQAFSISGYNFQLWRGNPRIVVAFALSLILCFLPTDKAVRFAVDHNTTLQLVETFIWSFGDSNSILLFSVLLVMLFGDMPFLSSGTPFNLVRTDRRTWITGQVIYIIAAASIYMLFVLVSTSTAIYFVLGSYERFLARIETMNNPVMDKTTDSTNRHWYKCTKVRKRIDNTLGQCYYNAIETSYELRKKWGVNNCLTR